MKRESKNQVVKKMCTEKCEKEILKEWSGKRNESEWARTRTYSLLLCSQGLEN
jgi:hypothetical protein